jgi:hypothetical protein
MTEELHDSEGGEDISENEIIDRLRLYGPDDPTTASLLREYRRQEEDNIGSSPEDFLTLDFRLDKLYRQAGMLPALRMVESHLVGLISRIETEKAKDENKDARAIFDRLAKDANDELASVREEIAKI